MNLLKKIFKWTGIIIGSALILLIILGLSLRLFSSKPIPSGELIDVGGFKLHVKAVGKRNHKPTLVIESGAGAPGEYYYWLGELLKDSIRVIQYDRAGIGYSELSNSPRDPETIAYELHTLLEKSGEKPPYILAGHSYGGHYIRIFKELYPDEVAGLVFLDSPHPDIDKRLKMPQPPSYVNTLYKAVVVLGDLGLLNLYTQMTKRHILWAPGLPDDIMENYRDYTLSGKYVRAYLEEEKGHKKLVELSKRASQFDTIPIRVFSGTNLNEPMLRKMGIDPDFIRTERENMQREMASLSKNGQVIFLDGGHITIFSLKENAELICNEILDFIETLETK